MKKQLLFSVMLITTATSFAQTAKVGFKAGITSSSIKGEAAENLNSLIDYSNGAITTGSKTGFYGGVNTNIALSDNISIEPGLYYSQKGYELKGALNFKGLEFLGANAKAALTSHYVDLPVLVKGNFNGFQVFAGPEVSYLAKADLTMKAGVLGINLYKKSIDATEQFNRWDAGITGGVGYQFSDRVNVSASYTHGLMKTDADQSFDAYNRSFKVGIGVNL